VNGTLEAALASEHAAKPEFAALCSRCIARARSGKRQLAAARGARCTAVTLPSVLAARGSPVTLPLVVRCRGLRIPPRPHRRHLRWVLSRCRPQLTALAYYRQLRPPAVYRCRTTALQPGACTRPPLALDQPSILPPTRSRTTRTFALTLEAGLPSTAVAPLRFWATARRRVASSL